MRHQWHCHRAATMDTQERSQEGRERNRPDLLLKEDPFEFAFEQASTRAWVSLHSVFQKTMHSFQHYKHGRHIGLETKVSPDVSTWPHCLRENRFLKYASTTLKFGSDVKHKQLDNGNCSCEHPSLDQLLVHPLAVMSYVPKDIALFLAGAIAGAVARTITAPLDRIKLLMQVHNMNASYGSVKSIGFPEAVVKIAKEEGLQGYWKGNLPQVLRLIPYSAIQLTSYELYKKLFKGKDEELSVVARLAAGACAGMTSTLATYPLDVFRLRLAVDPTSQSMIQVALNMLQEEGFASFYSGLGPSLLGIAPYIALNFCAFDLIKNSLPEDIRKTPAASFLTALLSSSLATTSCYPLDTIRRQMQMKGTPYHSVFEAFSGILDKDGIIGLYRGFVPNALKTLPNSSIRLTTFHTAKSIYGASQQEFEKLVRERKARQNL
ncbi:hypothetical protein KP509_33G053700 [Ceratopteris richardii]|uniref:Uncharacterized protein n=1 Tax=Ceratopteris richardii TaxID=49495 RepID=A0A8T2QQ58_CERRI|nr:hypothetical protein KP509_33G053700 [Ceratopteris richardii]